MTTEKGVKHDGEKNRVGLCLGGFARAVHVVSLVSTFGAKKYTDGGWI